MVSSTSIARQARPSVLVIDDSPSDLRLLFEMMSSMDLAVSVAFSGRKGVDRASLNPPDLILLDVAMPGMDGFAACQWLKLNARTRWIPVIFLTSANDLTQRLRGLTVGGVDYIGKPFSEAEVIARVQIHLELSRRRQGQGVSPPPSVDDAAAPDAPPPQTRQAQWVQLATQRLRQNLSAPASPEKLAREIGTNETSLNKAFQDAFGLPVYGWLREERMSQARHLLVSTPTAIASIADYLGFEHPANFTRAFKERFGMTPRELRNASADASPSAT